MKREIEMRGYPPLHIVRNLSLVQLENLIKQMNPCEIKEFRRNLNSTMELEKIINNN